MDRFRPVVISPHKDELLEHTRGYSSGSKPEDYLYAFGSTLISHEVRIRQAVDKLKKAHKFSKQELNALTQEAQQARMSRENFCFQALNGIELKEAPPADVSFLIHELRHIVIGIER